MVIRKTLLATMVNKVAVVTPDRKLAEIIDAILPNIAFYVKGWEGRDVLKEYFEAAKCEGLTSNDTIVRVTADCPLLRPEIIDECIRLFMESDVDYLYNSEGKHNDGTDVEVFSWEVLELAFNNATGEEREHVGLWMRRNLKTQYCKDAPPYEVESVNTQEEYENVCNIVRNKV